ncbi:hypothetical protein H8356DRAFT_1427972 [Neocallimastix lanati (nom. inval.)]|nr:hypothetical protein H8356DRAFT_1427972 [Neocallimastix sp. JGI-2020a]
MDSPEEYTTRNSVSEGNININIWYVGKSTLHNSNFHRGILHYRCVFNKFYMIFIHELKNWSLEIPGMRGLCIGVHNSCSYTAENANYNYII